MGRSRVSLLLSGIWYLAFLMMRDVAFLPLSSTWFVRTKKGKQRGTEFDTPTNTRAKVNSHSVDANAQPCPSLPCSY